MKAALNKTILGKWIITLAIPLLIYCIPTGEIFTKDLQLFLMITIGVILAVAFEFFNLMIPALLLPLLYILAGLSTFNVAFSGFASSTAILVVGALLFANVLEESGLLKRVAYWCILRTGWQFCRDLIWHRFGWYCADLDDLRQWHLYYCHPMLWGMPGV